jgi:hypothetical protein
MKTTIGVYDSHKTALNAIEALKNKGFPVNQMSVIGKVKIVNDNLQVKSREPIKNAGIGIGVVLGSALGLLSGAGIFAVPGLGFIFGAGAVIGTIAGGLVGGGIISLLSTIGIKKDKVVKYKEHLEEGKFLVIAQGNKNDLEDAKTTLHNCGEHLELCIL